MIDTGEIDLWQVGLDPSEAEIDELAAVLAPDEATRAARFARPILRHRFTAARGGLRRILARYVGVSARSLCFRYGPHGKPGLVGGGDLHFNLSHSEGQALVGVTRLAEIGVDIEALRPMRDRDAVARRTFTAREVAALAAVPAGREDAGFFACWTRKEAVVKTTGIGFAFELDWFDVPVEPDLEAATIVVNGPAEVSGRYGLWNVATVSGFAAAVALRSSWAAFETVRLVRRTLQPMSST